MKDKIVIPEGMLKAASEVGRYHSNPLMVLRCQLEAALRWLSENPISPTDAQVAEFCQKWDEDDTLHHNSGCCYTRAACLEWQRRMFLAPEPEVPTTKREIINDWLKRHQPNGSRVSLVGDEMADELLRELEAFRRGRNSK